LSAILCISERPETALPGQFIFTIRDDLEDAPAGGGSWNTGSAGCLTCQVLNREIDPVNQGGSRQTRQSRVGTFHNPPSVRPVLLPLLAAAEGLIKILKEGLRGSR